MKGENTRTYALITGASGGIGFELSKVMASNNHNLILVARSVEKLDALRKELTDVFNVDVICFSADLAKEDERIKLIGTIREQQLHINVLVNNAGFGDAGYFAEADWEKNERMIQLNITALTHLTREFLPDLINSGRGRILNVASVAGYMPGPLMAVYYASKSFVVSFSYALHHELKNTSVTVTTLSPGPVETNFFKAAGAQDAAVNKIMKPSTALSVAKFGYKRMMKGRKRAIQGWKYNLMLLGVRLVPSEITSAILGRLHK
ncbi:MAG TPA: SDR family oxidoreductase [Lentimicrobium sp.]|nr:SDR family oxidoreductase [Lentimicrobium sp.]